ncbi:antibiotic biosynthesis monooxygenase [Deminuibacter soli]|uniref:Antibiotic biosynthesis monooxygenase n=1 Tax=Deminuibacter soli TaxID=2291815 RepID=A0A3E1NGN6_9BACT|nr:antibiotic biosynthesis monooxygenase [Deminuibacter soli]RFM27042.1 antibiotic biosynthesis monooxygenase [Deminuibacter soli]
MNTVITRMWHGRTRASDADTYLEYLLRSGVPGYKSIPGNLSVEIWRRADNDVCHFWTVTKWNSWDSIREFAGEPLDTAKYYEEDHLYLLEFEEKVTHYETFVR